MATSQETGKAQEEDQQHQKLVGSRKSSSKVISRLVKYLLPNKKMSEVQVESAPVLEENHASDEAAEAVVNGGSAAVNGNGSIHDATPNGSAGAGGDEAIIQKKIVGELAF